MKGRLGLNTTHLPVLASLGSAVSADKLLDDFVHVHGVFEYFCEQAYALIFSLLIRGCVQVLEAAAYQQIAN